MKALPGAGSAQSVFSSLTKKLTSDLELLVVVNEAAIWSVINGHDLFEK